MIQLLATPPTGPITDVGCVPEHGHVDLAVAVGAPADQGFGDLLRALGERIHCSSLPATLNLHPLPSNHQPLSLPISRIYNVSPFVDTPPLAPAKSHPAPPSPHQPPTTTCLPTYLCRFDTCHFDTHQRTHHEISLFPNPAS